jgi:glycerol kinase
MAQVVGAIDQGTTSTRFILFDRAATIVGLAQREHRQITPQPGHVEHDPDEIWRNTRAVIIEALEKARLEPSDLAAIGITNQRETTVLWDRRTGRPLHNALVWQDMRTDRLVAELAEDGGRDRFRPTTGLPLATYFSGPKLAWLLANLPGARAMAEAGDALFGTVDCFLLWHLTGGPEGGLHLTDVTNASRTQLMDLATLRWDDGILAALDIPRACLPDIRSSSEVYGEARAPLGGVPIAGILGDQQAALFGQAGLAAGDAKNTYGTGCFVLLHTGTAPAASRHGLITTVAAKLGAAPATYALEGSIAVAGSLVQWLRDGLGLIASSSEIEPLAASVPDNGDVYVVPAFSGLFAPHWRADARGIICGLTRYSGKGHLARAALEAVAFQTAEVIDAMVRDSGVPLSALKVDGGMVVNELLMQFQADILDVPVVRPRVIETTALGAAYAAGLATGFFASTDEIRANWQADRHWRPAMDAATRRGRMARWSQAVERSLGWVGGAARS